MSSTRLRFMLFPFVPICLGRPRARGRHSQAEVSRGRPTEKHFRRVRRRIPARWRMPAAFKIRSGKPKPVAGGNGLEERRRAWEFAPKQGRGSVREREHERIAKNCCDRPRGRDRTGCQLSTAYAGIAPRHNARAHDRRIDKPHPESSLSIKAEVGVEPVATAQAAE